MGRTAVILYGIFAYLLAMASLLYAIGFVGNYWVPKSIDIGNTTGQFEAVIVNLILLGLFAVQHSGMARRAFKSWLTGFLPEPAERSTYVLLSGLILALLYWQWRPITEPIWSVENSAASLMIQAIYFLGWGIVLLSSFLISHTELFGLQQVTDYWSGKDKQKPHFREPFLYRFVRHPIYFGLLLAFWATPDMTLGHLIFAIATTGYILIGATLEERDLVTIFGDTYEDYRRRVSMLIPWPWR